MIHELKTWKEYFDKVISYEKNFELRKNDRDYQVGDVLWLKEWNNETNEYTGSTCARTVNYILEGGQFGLEKGYVIMDIR